MTPNLDHLIKLQKDKEFYDVYQKSEWVVCDSKILYLFGKLLKEIDKGKLFLVRVSLLLIICTTRMMRIAEFSCWEQKRE